MFEQYNEPFPASLYPLVSSTSLSHLVFCYIFSIPCISISQDTRSYFFLVTWGISKSLSQHFKVSGSLCFGRAIFSTKHDYHRKSCIKLLICHKSLTSKQY